MTDLLDTALTPVFFSTSNLAKFAQARLVLARFGFDVTRYLLHDVEYPEPYGEERESFLGAGLDEVIKRAGATSIVFIEDTTVAIHALSSAETGEFPGQETKEWFARTTHDQLLAAIDAASGDRGATVRSDIALHVPGLERYVFFSGAQTGVVAEAPGQVRPNLAYPWLGRNDFSSWFIPHGADKVLAAMSYEESARFDYREKCLLEVGRRLEEYQAIGRSAAVLVKNRRPPRPAGQVSLIPDLDVDTVVIVIGAIGAGKTTIGRHLVLERGFRHLEGSALVAQLARNQGITGDSGFDLADRLFAKCGSDAVERHAVWPDVQRRGGPVIYTGARTLEGILYLRTKARDEGMRCLVWYVDAPEFTRHIRVIERVREGGLASAEDFHAKSQRDIAYGASQYGDVIADCRIGNIRGVDTLLDAVGRALDEDEGDFGKSAQTRRKRDIVHALATHSYDALTRHHPDLVTTLDDGTSRLTARGQVLQQLVGTKSPPVWAAWGKWPASRPPHPLVCHLLDVALAVRALLPRLVGPRHLAELRTGFGPLGDADGWIALLGGLHDIGKYSPAFQALRADPAIARLGAVAARDIRTAQPATVPRSSTPHALLSSLHVMEMLQSWGADPAVAAEIAVALGGHHGHLPTPTDLVETRNRSRDHGGDTWRLWRDDMVLAVAAALGLPDPRTLSWSQVRIGLGAAVALTGLTTVADWLVSDEVNYSSPQEPVDLDDYVRRAAIRVERAMTSAGLRSWSPPVGAGVIGPGFAKLGTETAPAGTAHAGRASAVAMTVAEHWRSPSVTIIEAPVGTGKTRAALLAAATMAHAQGLDGVYIACPTRATRNRITAALQAWMRTVDDPTSVSSIPDDDPVPPEEHSTAFGSEDLDDPARNQYLRKRGLFSGVAIGTVDGALRSVMRSAHWPVDLTALSNKVLVFVEADTYEPYKSMLLDRLLTWLGELGTSVVLSADALPLTRRRQVVNAWQAGGHPVTTNQSSVGPDGDGVIRITVAGEQDAVVTSAQVSAEVTTTAIKLDQPVADDHVVQWLLEATDSAQCVAVVHNTVSRANATHEALRNAVSALPASRRPEILLLHGRLERSTRHRVEEWLTRHVGPTRQRTRAIVVGTPLLQYSSARTFGALLTDLAPIDHVLQRAVRLMYHHDRDTRPVLGITGIAETDGVPDLPRYTSVLYSRYIVLRTWAVLKDATSIALPDDTRRYLDAVYGPSGAIPCPLAWKAVWARAEAAHRARGAKGHTRVGDECLPAPTDDLSLTALSTYHHHTTDMPTDWLSPRIRARR